MENEFLKSVQYFLRLFASYKNKYFLFMTVDDIAKVKLPEWVGG